METAPGGEMLHGEAKDNVAFDWDCGDATATAAAFASADTNADGFLSGWNSKFGLKA